MQQSVARLDEPPNSSGPLYPRLQNATTFIQGTAILLDQAFFGGRLTQTSMEWQEGVERFVQNHPGLQNTLNVLHNLADFSTGFGLQIVDDFSLGLFGRLTGIEWSNGSDAFQTGRSLGRTISNLWGTIELLVGLTLTAASVKLIPPTAGGATLCAVITTGGCLPLGGAALVIETAALLAGISLSGHGSAMLVHNASHPVGRPEDATLHYGSNTDNTTRNAQILRENLRENMEQAGIEAPADYQAHHIVPSTHRDMQEARQILERWDIDINSPENGIFLPEEIHNGLANDHTYMRAVTEDLKRATSREEAIEILQRIGQRLLDGTYPRSGR